MTSQTPNFDHTNSISLSNLVAPIRGTNHELQKLNNLFEQGIGSLNESTKSQERLGKKILWLNWVLTVATMVGAIATAIIAYSTYIATHPSPIP